MDGGNGGWSGEISIIHSLASSKNFGVLVYYDTMTLVYHGARHIGQVYEEVSHPAPPEIG